MTRTARWSAAASLIVIGALLSAPVTAATAVPGSDARATARPVDPVEPLIPMVDVRVADFAAEAETLPPQLEQALERDAGLSGAEWLAQAEASAVGVEVVDALRDHIEVRDARLDGLELVVTVGTEAEAAVVESVGARAEIGPAPGRVGDIEGLEPAADLRGGMPYFFPDTADWDNNPETPNTTNTFRCSIGFVGVDVVTAETQIMSAGHCEGDTGSARTAQNITRPTASGGSLGPSAGLLGNAGLHVTHEYPNPSFPTENTFYDLGITEITNVTWTAKPEIVTWGGSTSGAPLSSTPLVIRDAGPALNGATLCKSGSTTGWTCGSITDVDQIQLVGASSCDTPGAGYCVGSIGAQICVRGGDSGGAAVVGTRAVGIVSASSEVNPAVACSASNFGVFATLYSAVPAYEQVTKVYPDWEPLIGLAAPTLSTNGLNRFETSLGGSLTGASTRHDVSVELDLGGTLLDEVNASGAWSVDIGAVPNGTREYTLQSSWGSGVQTSATTTGRFLKAAAVRLSGASRYETAIAISQYAFPGTPNVPVVYIAGGAGFPDALSAGPAARAEGGPLLLTEAETLPTAVRDELVRLNPDEIVVVGGTGVVSSSVFTALGSYAPSVVRVSGASRYLTSQAIAQRVLSNGGFTTGQPLWVATGTGYADALSAGAAAADAGVPILLVDGGLSSLPTSTRTFIDDTLQASAVYIAGGTGVVSAGIETALNGIVGSAQVERFGGAGRFDTSRLINAFAHPTSAPEVFLTYGYNFPDALAGGVLAGVVGGPLYITDTPCVQSAIVDDILDLGPAKVTVLGGTALLSNNARDLKTC
jgi:putative cell wall-binding protein